MSSASTFSLSDLERMYAEIARHGNESSPAAQALLQQIYARRQRGERAPSDGVLTEYYLPNQNVPNQPGPLVDQSSGWEMIQLMDELRGYE